MFDFTFTKCSSPGSTLSFQQIPTDSNRFQQIPTDFNGFQQIIDNQEVRGLFLGIHALGNQPTQRN